MTVAACFVCRKHRGEIALAGGPIVDDGLVFASHRWETPDGVADEVYLGHVFVETRRHAPSFADLTADEAQAVGLLGSRLSRAMKDVLGADYVFVAVVGTGVPHFHLHLLARQPGMPEAIPWYGVGEWEGARRGDHAAVAELTRGLRTAL